MARTVVAEESRDMTKDEILKLWNLAMLETADGLDAMVYFTKAVEENERQACAKVCDDRVIGDHNREDEEAKRCAAAIRARNVN